jgi:hypothetical protein
MLIRVAYIIDTGVNIKHEEFEGRAVWGATIPTGDEDEDGNGHGTHVAGTIASKTYGVAKKAKVVAVKVLRSNGSGSMSDVLKGVEWAAEATEKEEAAEKKKGKKSTYKVFLITVVVSNMLRVLLQTCLSVAEAPRLSIWQSTQPLMLVSILPSQQETITKTLATTPLPHPKRPSLLVHLLSPMPAHTSPTTVNVLTSLLLVSTSFPPGSDPNTPQTPSPELPWHLPIFAVFFPTSFLLPRLPIPISLFL